MNPPVLFYYRLTGFYQNHRRYVKSFQADQLKGVAVDNGTIASSLCDPLRLDERGRAYYPCGLIANSMFNDTYTSPVLQNVPDGSASSSVYSMKNNSGIAWDSDGKLYGKTEYKLDQIAVPPNWVERFGGIDYTEAHPPPNLELDQAFQVWMRTAGLPTFSKLAQRNDNDVMKAGQYKVDINHLFPADVYGGTKAIIISTRTVMGGRNPYLGIAFVVVGGLCILLGAIFTATHLIKPRYIPTTLRHAVQDINYSQETRRPHIPLVEQRPAQHCNNNRPRRRAGGCLNELCGKPIVNYDHDPVFSYSHRSAPLVWFWVLGFLQHACWEMRLFPSC